MKRKLTLRMYHRLARRLVAGENISAGHLQTKDLDK
jgi:hypothetical protein